MQKKITLHFQITLEMLHHDRNNFFLNNEQRNLKKRGVVLKPRDSLNDL